MTTESIETLLVIGMFGILQFALHPSRLRRCGTLLRDAFGYLLPGVSPLQYAVVPVRLWRRPRYR